MSFSHNGNTDNIYFKNEIIGQDSPYRLELEGM